MDVRHFRQSITTIAAILAAPVGLPAPVAARTVPSPSAADAEVAAVTACLDITDSAARLACFDANAPKLRTAVQTGTIAVVDREEVNRTRRALFGFPLPTEGLFGHRAEEKKPEFSEIQGKIAQCHQTADARWRLVLDDGSVWATDEVPNTDPRNGDSIRVKRAALGSFFGNIDGARAVRMHRIG